MSAASFVRRAAFVGLATGLLCAAAVSSRADVFVLKDGRSIDGKVLREKDGFVWAKTLAGTEKFAAADVTSRTPGESEVETYERLSRVAAADAKDAAAQWALYEFLRDHAGDDKDLRKEGEKALRATLKADPDHEAAHDAAGETRFDGKWVPKSDVPRLKAEQERVELRKEWSAKLATGVEVYATDHFLLLDGTHDKNLVQRSDSLEAAYARVRELLDVDELWPGRSPTITLPDHVKYLVVLDKFASSWRMSEEWMKFAKLETGGGVWRHAPEATQLRFPNRGVEAMWYSTVHMVGHLAIWRYWGGGEIPPTWLEEGLGQWIEMEVMGENLATCVGGKKESGVGGTSDRPKKKKAKKGDQGDIDERKERCIEAIQDGTFPAMRLFLRMHLGDYGSAEEGGAYGLVTWLISREDAKFAEIVKALRAGGARDDEPWKRVYGYEVIEDMEKEWKTWVLTEW